MTSGSLSGVARCKKAVPSLLTRQSQTPARHSVMADPRVLPVLIRTVYTVCDEPVVLLAGDTCNAGASFKPQCNGMQGHHSCKVDVPTTQK